MKKKPRRQPNATEREACALLAIRRGDGTPLIPAAYHDKSAKEICALVDYHHYVPHAWTGSMAPKDMVPMLRVEHQEETAKRTIPMIAKTKRISKEHAEFRARLLAKVSGETTSPKTKKRSLKSKPFGSWRRFDGTVIRKEDKRK